MKHLTDTSTPHFPATLLEMLKLTPKKTHSDQLSENAGTEFRHAELRRRAAKIIETAEQKLADAEQRFAQEKTAMEQGTLDNVVPPQTALIAFETYSELLAACGESIERLVKKLDYDVTLDTLKSWSEKKMLEFSELVPVIDRLAAIFIPDDPALADRAANIMIGLPPSQFRTFEGSHGVEGCSSAPH